MESHLIIVLLLSVIVAIFLTAVVYKDINAQSIETLTGLSKVANPQIKVGGDAQEIAINEDMNKIYLYNPTNGTVSVIDSNLGYSVKDIRVGNYSSEAGLNYFPLPGSHPMVVDYLDHRIYVQLQTLIWFQY